MDSGNSGSLQSSSGGDEEYDSRTESISAFLNQSSHVAASLSIPSHHHLPPSSSLFDPLSNYLDPFSRSTAPPPNSANSLLNLDMVWPRGLRSEPTCTEISNCNLMGSSSSSALVAPGGQAGPFQVSSPKNGTRPLASSSSEQTNTVRNSKKRSRASRRAPTTVLTTDTSNFRAMVQEFTGIPAPPFSASLPFSRNRFDLFGTASTTMRSGHLEPPLPPYLLRPFAQKLHAPSFASSTNPTGTTSGATIMTAVGSSNTSNSTQGLLNMQNPIFTFQSMLQASGPPPASPPPRYPFANVPVFGSKSQGSLTTTVVEDFTMGGHGVTSDGMSLRNDNNNKMNYSNSSLEFQVEKGSSENVTSRGEGMVDSWICSSD